MSYDKFVTQADTTTGEDDTEDEELPKLSHFDKAKILQFEMVRNPRTKNKLMHEFKIEKLKSAYGNIDRYIHKSLKHQQAPFQQQNSD